MEGIYWHSLLNLANEMTEDNGIENILQVMTTQWRIIIHVNDKSINMTEPVKHLQNY